MEATSLDLLSTKFIDYLNEATKKVLEKYPDAKFFNGEYRPDITNFHYEYNFKNRSTGIKVVINTFEGAASFLMMKTPVFKYLKSITLPVKYNLLDAYYGAKEKGTDPNLGGAIVFLQDDSSQDAGAQYWFLDGNSDKWVTVNTQPPHSVNVTAHQPIVS